MGILSTIVNKKAWVFVGGIAAGLVLPPIVKSKAARKAAVCVTAKGMRLKDDAVAAYNTIKEGAQDVYAEAKEQAGSCDCGCDGPEADAEAEAPKTKKAKA